MSACHRFGAFPFILAAALAACGGSAEPGSAAHSQEALKASRVIRVPQDQPTIAAAMAAAVPGTTVRLAPGTYRETLALRTGVRVVGGPSTIDATGLDHGIVGDPGVVDAGVQRVDVVNSSAAGIFLDGASATFRQVSSRLSGFSGLTANSSRLTIADSDLSRNGTRGLNVNLSDVSLEESRLEENGGPGIGMSGGSLRMKGTTIAGNRAGILAFGSGDFPDLVRPSLHLEENSVTGNRNLALWALAADVESEGDRFDQNGGGLVANVGAVVSASAGSISGNLGNGIWVLDSEDSFFCGDPDCTIGRHVQATTGLRLDRMRVDDNGATGLAVTGGGQISLRDSSLSRNGAAWGASGIWISSRWDYDLGDGVVHTIDIPGSLTVRGSHIDDNAAWGAGVEGTSSLDLGGAPGGGSSIAGNQAGAVASLADPSRPVPAQGNWWGTSDAAAIAAMMYGPVDFVPFLTAAP